jgi:hypothetical protein
MDDMLKDDKIVILEFKVFYIVKLLRKLIKFNLFLILHFKIIIQDFSFQQMPFLP